MRSYPNAASERIPRALVNEFEVSMSRHRNTKKGLAISLLVGAGAGILINVHDTAQGFDAEGWEEFGDAIATMIIVPAATLAGTLIGAATTTEKWVDVSPSQINLSITPTRDKGLRAALSFEF